MRAFTRVRRADLVQQSLPMRLERDPRGATLPTAVMSPWGTSAYTDRFSGYDVETAMREAYYSNVYVWACSQARARDVSSVPIRVGADPDAPGDYDPNHPIAKLLGPAPGSPAPKLSARRLISWTIVQLDIAGRFAWEVAAPMRPDYPFELWPLKTSAITAVQSTNPGEYWKSFEYQTNNKKITFQPEEVVYDWRPSADDWRTPESLLRAARLDVSVAVMQDRYDHSFLINDARPAAVVVHEEFADPEQRDSWRRQFLDHHQGPNNAGRVAFAQTSPSGAQPKDALFVQTLGLSQKDAEFVARYEAKVRAICVAFGTPLSRLGDSSKRSFSNADRETLNYWQDTVRSLLDEFAEMCNTYLMPLARDDSNVVFFDTSVVPALQPPKRFAVENVPALIQAKVITKSEAREELGLDPELPEELETQEVPAALQANAETEQEQETEPDPNEDQLAADERSGRRSAPGGPFVHRRRTRRPVGPGSGVRPTP